MERFFAPPSCFAQSFSALSFAEIMAGCLCEAIPEFSGLDGEAGQKRDKFMGRGCSPHHITRSLMVGYKVLGRESKPIFADE